MLSSIVSRSKWKHLIIWIILLTLVLSLAHLYTVNLQLESKTPYNNAQYRAKQYSQDQGLINQLALNTTTVLKSYSNLSTVKEQSRLLIGKASTDVLPLKSVDVVKISSLFTRYFKKFKVDLVVAEPRIIAKFLSAEDFIKVQSITERYSSNGHITFMSSDQLQLDVPSWKHFQDDHLYDKRVEINCYNIKHNMIIRHTFCLSKNILAHIIFVEKRNDFFWFPKVPKIPNEVKGVITREKLMLGEYDGAFDQFTSVKNGEISIPSDTAYFIKQIPVSTFIECNKTLNHLVKAEYEFADENAEVSGNMKQAIVSMRNMMRKESLLFWAADGTLLGWFRQCAIINGTGDLDFAMWAKDYTPELLEKFDKEGSGSLSDTLGNRYSGFEMRTPFIDLFLAYEGMDDISVVTFSFDPATMYRLTYPKYTLCSAELLETKILVPCEAKAIVTVEYGTGWMKLTKDYGYTNIRREAVYDAEFWLSEMYHNYNNGGERYAGKKAVYKPQKQY